MPPDLELLLLLLLWAGWCELDEDVDDAAADAESESPWCRLTAKVVLEAVESLLAVLSCLDLAVPALPSSAVALSHGSSPAASPLRLLPRDDDVAERMLLLLSSVVVVDV